jgi:hypothetical protein
MALVDIDKRNKILASSRFQSYNARLNAAVRSVESGFSPESEARYWEVSLGDIEAKLPPEPAPADDQLTLFDDL